MKLCKRKIVLYETLGEYLKKIREAKNISLDEASYKTKIKTEFLKAIEESRYSVFQGEVYILGYLKRYSQFLEIPYKKIIKRFKKEIYSQNYINSNNIFKINKKKIRHLSSFFFIGCVGLLIIFYLISKIIFIISEPKFTLFYPKPGSIINQKIVLLQGRVNHTKNLYLNDKLINIDNHGYFSKKLLLKPGENLLRFEFFKDYGKIYRKFIKVYYKIENSKNN